MNESATDCRVDPSLHDMHTLARQGLMKQGLALDGLWLDMNEVSNYCTGDHCVDPGKQYYPNASRVV